MEMVSNDWKGTGSAWKRSVLCFSYELQVANSSWNSMMAILRSSTMVHQNEDKASLTRGFFLLCDDTPVNLPVNAFD